MKININDIAERVLNDRTGELPEDEFLELENPSGGLNEEDNNLLDIYKTIIDVLKYYCDIEEKYYSIIALWIIGTYFHHDFPSYPYLFFNAMRGSGKSRVLRLITYLSSNGSMLNSLTEAVLFRTSGTLGIDEFEGVSRKGNESLKELLNSAYKKGITVKRMKKKKVLGQEEQVVEEFEVYRPILMANIAGMEEVLGDRCIQIILSRSSNSNITKKMEIFDNDTTIQKIKAFPFEKCRLCRVMLLSEIYKGWNNFVNFPTKNDTNNIHTTHTQHDTNDITSLYKKIDDSEIDGRNLELMFPLLILASGISKEVLEELLKILKEIVDDKKKDDLVESIDVSLIDYVSSQLENKWFLSKDILRDFKNFIQSEEEWLNDRWLGKALKRLSLIKDKKRMNYGRMYMFDVNKAQEKMVMFR